MYFLVVVFLNIYVILAPTVNKSTAHCARPVTACSVWITLMTSVSSAGIGLPSLAKYQNIYIYLHKNMSAADAGVSDSGKYALFWQSCVFGCQAIFYPPIDIVGSRERLVIVERYPISLAFRSFGWKPTLRSLIVTRNSSFGFRLPEEFKLRYGACGLSASSPS